MEDGVKEGEKMQIELTQTAGNENFYKKLDLNINLKLLQICIYGLKNNTVYI